MQQLSLVVDSPEPILMCPQNAEKGSLTELVVSQDSAIKPFQLLPILAQAAKQQRWLMWLSPQRSLTKHQLKSLGLDHTPVLYLPSCQDTQLALTSKILQSGNSHMIVHWQGKLHSHERQVLRSLALKSGSHIILIQTCTES